jgi:hypothetical protein
MAARKITLIPTGPMGHLAEQTAALVADEQSGRRWR